MTVCAGTSRGDVRRFYPCLRCRARGAALRWSVWGTSNIGGETIIANRSPRTRSDVAAAAWERKHGPAQCAAALAD